jgi:hypothetical protein
MEVEDVAGKKVPVKGGGICIYCGWDGDGDLRDEDTMPYSLGGNTELLGASCSDCEVVILMAISRMRSSAEVVADEAAAAANKAAWPITPVSSSWQGFGVFEHRADVRLRGVE